jgi:hypothetical protein
MDSKITLASDVLTGLSHLTHLSSLAYVYKNENFYACAFLCMCTEGFIYVYVYVYQILYIFLLVQYGNGCKLVCPLS